MIRSSRYGIDLQTVCGRRLRAEVSVYNTEKSFVTESTRAASKCVCLLDF